MDLIEQVYNDIEILNDRQYNNGNEIKGYRKQHGEIQGMGKVICKIEEDSKRKGESAKMQDKGYGIANQIKGCWEWCGVVLGMGKTGLV